MDNPYRNNIHGTPNPGQSGQFEPPEPPTRNPIKDDAPGIITKLIIVALIVLVGGYILFMVSGAIGHEAEGFFRHIKRLFHNAPYMFRSPKGFGAFVELILIAGFVGWVIHRFKK